VILEDSVGDRVRGRGVSDLRKDAAEEPEVGVDAIIRIR